MKKSIISTLFVVAVVLMMGACETTNTKTNSNYAENGKLTNPQHPVCVVTQKELITDNAFKAMVRGKAQLVEMLRFKVQAMIDEKYPRLNKLDDRLSNMIAPLSKEEKEALDFNAEKFIKAMEERLDELVSNEDSGKEQKEQQLVAESKKKMSEDEIRSKIEEEFNRDKGWLSDEPESSDDQKNTYIDISRYVAEHSSSGLETMEKWGYNILMCVDLEKFEESADAYLKQIEILTEEDFRREELNIQEEKRMIDSKMFEEAVKAAPESEKTEEK